MTRTASQKRRAQRRNQQQPSSRKNRQPTQRQQRVLKLRGYRSPQQMADAMLPQPPKAMVALASRTIASSHQVHKTSFVRSALNPFSGNTCIPDGTKNSGCFSAHALVTLQTGTGTSSGVIVNPDPANWYALDANSTFAATTYPAGSYWSPAPDLTAMISMFGKWRIVSMAIRVTPAANAVGTLLLGQMTADRTPNALSTLSMNGMSLVSGNYTVIPNQGSSQVTWRAEDKQDHDYQLFGPNVGLTQIPSNLPSIFVQGFGLATNTAAATVEIITNWQVEYHRQSTMVGETVDRPADPGWFEKTQNVLNKVSQIAYTGLGVVNSISSMLS